MTFDLPSFFFAKIMLTFELPKKRLFLQNGVVGSSKVNTGSSKVNTFFSTKLGSSKVNIILVYVDL